MLLEACTMICLFALSSTGGQKRGVAGDIFTVGRVQISPGPPFTFLVLKSFTRTQCSVRAHHKLALLTYWQKLLLGATHLSYPILHPVWIGQSNLKSLSLITSMIIYPTSLLEKRKMFIIKIPILIISNVRSGSLVPTRIMGKRLLPLR